MAIIFTKHAKEMLILRKLKEDLAEECVSNPDQILSAREENLKESKRIK